MNAAKRSIRIIGGVLVVYALLVATHLGEFWPFSIYPMFSQAGNPWTRSIVRELPSQADPDTLSWEAVRLQDLPGRPYPLEPKGINQNDVANYVSKTETWTDERVQGLRSLFFKNRSLDASLLVYRVRGELVADTVSISATPVLLFTPSASHLNPSPADRTVAGRSPPGN
jgi:hypothetical protein